MRTTRTPLKRVARKLRTDGTDAERRLWYHLRDRRLAGFKFRRQTPIGRYVADFVCVDARLIVELDGGQHTEQAARDAARSRFLESQGFRLLRFWNDAALADTDVVLAQILEALGGIEDEGPSP